VRKHYLRRVKKERNILHRVKKRKANRIGHTLRRNCLLKHIIEGKLEEVLELTGRQGIISKRLLGDLEETTAYCKFKEQTLDRNVSKTCFGRLKGPVVRQTT
jgi:hypothetical protein